MNFDRVARSYFVLEKIAFGGELQRARIALLERIENPSTVLIVGEGDGRFLAKFVRRFPQAEIDAVDSSPRMIELARRRLGKNSRVRFHGAEMASWESPENRRYDLIITHFVLDCFRQEKLADIVRKLAGLATSRAQWLLADFCVPRNGFAKWRARLWLALMYRFFRLTTRIEASELIDPTPFLETSGFEREACRQFCGGIVRSELWRTNEKSKPDCRR